MLHTQSRMPFSPQEEGDSDASYNMDELSEKPDTKEAMLCDSAGMRYPEQANPHTGKKKGGCQGHGELFKGHGAFAWEDEKVLEVNGCDG